MQIAPRDQRRLLYRVCAVLIAMRAVSMFTIDLNATEVAAAHGLATPGAVAPILSQLTALWMSVAGHVAGIVRLPSLAADLAALLLLISYCRFNGWGTLSGLLAGFFFAMTPFGLDEGWRADGTPILSMGAVGALLLARRALKLGEPKFAIASAGIVALMTAASPVTAMLLPAALYASLRSIAGAKTRSAVAVGWVIAIGAGIGIRVALGQPLPPQIGLAGAWLADPGFNGASAALPDGAGEGFIAALMTLSPGGVNGEFAGFLQTMIAPDWRIWLGAALWPLAFVGLMRGEVLADPMVPTRAALASKTGAGVGDGWRSLGVGAPTSPRLLGERDWGPLLLGVLVPCGWVAWACAHGKPHGVVEALAIARPFACLLLGLGLTALAATPSGPQELRRKRFVSVMVALTLLQFAIGGHHVLQNTASQERLAPHKIATFVRDEAPRGHVLALGAAGLPVAYKLDPYRTNKNIRRASIEALPANRALEASIKEGAPFIAVTGDNEALATDGLVMVTGNGKAAVRAGMILDKQLDEAGYTLIDDGARYLSWFAVRVYQRGEKPMGIRVKPQLTPGVAP
jgi:hypothetical protein